MIISCPQCDTRFDVPSAIFASGGRKVRCASCSHTWVQEDNLQAQAAGVAESAAEKTEQPENKAPFKDMLNKVRAKVEGEKSPSLHDTGKSSGIVAVLKNDFKEGAILIAIACACVIAGFFIWRAFAPSLIYGQGLAFNNMTIERNDGDVTITGEIVNSMSEDRGVPSIQVMSVLDHGVEGDIVLVRPEMEILSGGQTIPLSISLHDVGAEVQSIHLTFAGVSVDSGAGAAVTDTPDQSDTTNQTDHHDGGNGTNGAAHDDGHHDATTPSSPTAQHH